MKKLYLQLVIQEPWITIKNEHGRFTYNKVLDTLNAKKQASMVIITKYILKKLHTIKRKIKYFLLEKLRQF